MRTRLWVSIGSNYKKSSLIVQTFLEGGSFIYKVSRVAFFFDWDIVSIPVWFSVAHVGKVIESSKHVPVLMIEASLGWLVCLLKLPQMPLAANRGRVACIF